MLLPSSQRHDEIFDWRCLGIEMPHASLSLMKGLLYFAAVLFFFCHAALIALEGPEHSAIRLRRHDQNSAQCDLLYQ
ncbi:hypothetical protein J5226_23635 [Lysobacter sp. K5869]|uniref:hypothetical protein n=1 Tax=Lysobacter sp. K5869 TaxID=2820808 RepID=UPI001C0608E0|nr:hypothetical protein [Lysobacter sp. K5869]QWP76536.1 hypothetical protein J5226_23635 [Lysobacter sp. K5869]